MDVSFVRKKFPALERDFIFMDNAGGSQILGSSIDYINEYYKNYNVQLGASYKVSATAGEKLEQATKQVAGFINSPGHKEVVMGPSTSMLLRILSLSLSAEWQEGDEVIVTNTDHEANVSCWTDLEQQGIKIKIWKANQDDFELKIEELENLLSSRTRLVAVTHCSNILGSINPIKKITGVVHNAGALICVDGVAYAPHRKVDVQELGVDFYIFSWYKLYGPHLAVMYGKIDLFTKMKGINHYFFKPDDVPYKFQPGNYNFELTYSLKGVTEYFTKFHDYHYPDDESDVDERKKQAGSFELIASYEEQLAAPLLEYLASVPDVKIIGEPTADSKKRVPTISFIHKDFSSREIVERTDPYNIGIRFGDFYAKKLVADFDLLQYEGVVRVSLVHYNTIEEVKKLIEVFKRIFSNA
ncbi:cysteine desulfurase-like protein [Antarcticibacterium flavum]|uniref:Cysteine desulfurase-like protein n=1 Tax=Antarcticibacterium flavum TaxID=2058175 RepID=A0A5B7X416_9FLAO|nr:MULTISPECIES: cysteine desulfurase-like protein [Antarcticibacterium]MCM4159058.1 cysteine desulfurase-like protein [Antarcticibacterium sp. W02-3]QCY69461.1 cysteine desulfurase-like protein [Antarcticibacterium flavum]